MDSFKIYTQIVSPPSSGRKLYSLCTFKRGVHQTTFPREEILLKFVVEPEFTANSWYFNKYVSSHLNIKVHFVLGGLVQKNLARGQTMVMFLSINLGARGVGQIRCKWRSKENRRGREGGELQVRRLGVFILYDLSHE